MRQEYGWECMVDRQSLRERGEGGWKRRVWQSARINIRYIFSCSFCFRHPGGRRSRSVIVTEWNLLGSHSTALACDSPAAADVIVMLPPESLGLECRSTRTPKVGRPPPPPVVTWKGRGSSGAAVIPARAPSPPQQQLYG